MTAKKTDDDVAVDVDLDALLKSKAGGDGYHNQKTFRCNGETFHVNARMPVFVAGLINDDRISDGLTLWLGEEQAKKLAPYLDMESFQELLKGLYGAELGE